MSRFKRADRVADLIQMEISDILLRQVRDPRIGAVTITGAKVSDDLRTARIFFVESYPPGQPSRPAKPPPAATSDAASSRQ